MKLVANLALGAAIVTLGEALSRRVPRAKRDILLDALADSPIGPIVGAKRANVESDQFAPNFKLRHAAKDLRLARWSRSRQGPRAANRPGRIAPGWTKPQSAAPATSTSRRSWRRLAERSLPLTAGG